MCAANAQPEPTALREELDAIVLEGMRRGYSPLQIAIGYPHEDYPGIIGQSDPEVLRYLHEWIEAHPVVRSRKAMRQDVGKVYGDRKTPPKEMGLFDRQLAVSTILRRIGVEQEKHQDVAAVLEVAARILGRADLALMDDDLAILAKGVGRLPDPERFPTTELRAAVMIRDRFKCRTCEATRDLSIDHITPWSRGGATILENLQVLCRSCNSRKGTK